MVVYYLNHYVIDWDKVLTLDDVKRVLKAMDIAFEPDYLNLDDIRDLVKFEKKK